MSTLTRSATLPYASTDAALLISTARRLLLDPIEIGPIRLVGVGFSGRPDVQQESLFPDLDQGAEDGPVSGSQGPVPAPVVAGPTPWRIGDDVMHPDHGHGWVQGAGARRDDDPVRDQGIRARPSRAPSAPTFPRSAARIRSTVWIGRSTSTRCTAATVVAHRQPQAATISSTGSPRPARPSTALGPARGRSVRYHDRAGIDERAARTVAGVHPSARHPGGHRDARAPAAQARRAPSMMAAPALPGSERLRVPDRARRRPHRRRVRRRRRPGRPR